MDRIPTLYMMVGLPGSGKSTVAKDNLYGITGTRIASDEIRKELFGDVEYDRSNNEKLFNTLHTRVKALLTCGEDVIYDATNIKKRRRIAFLRTLSGISCKKVCVVMATPYVSCLEQNRVRISNGEPGVPDEAIKRMYMNWEPPHKSEGWDKIYLKYSWGDEANRDLQEDMSLIWLPFNQDNSHHRLTLGEHMISTKEFLDDKLDNNLILDQDLKIAALIHDIGKPFTKTYTNKKGEESINAHYYNHHNVGSYDAMFYKFKENLTNERVLDICNLIFYHMHPYMGWKSSEKTKEKDRKLLGDEMFNRIMLLHEADVAAH